ncbi:MAG: sulfite exporter TauE/SafE family protein [Thermoleophilia bacterium]|nr:sulfite exporter TauE/SafE family protein [Thermoleophilia bacterium]
MLTLLAGALIALVVAAVTTPAGVSGAVLLLPVQVGILGVPSPAATPTNLLYNLIATPGPVARHARQGEIPRALTLLMLAGTLPGVVAGALLRATVLDSPRAVAGIIALVLLPLGVLLVSGRPAPPVTPRLGGPALVAVAAGVGVVGGLYGIGGGALLAPALVMGGHAIRRAAPAALTVTLVTSVAGIAVFEAVALATADPDTVGPDWALGLAMGAGGLVGGYLGARYGRRVPERALRRVLGVVVLAVALRYGAALVS